MNRMIVFRDYDKKALCGEVVHLKKGDKLISRIFEGREYVCLPDNRLIAAVYSQDYVDHFNRNYDGNGIERGELAYKLSNQIFTNKQKTILIQKWSKYLMPYSDVLLFNNRLYEAPLDILKSINDDITKEGDSNAENN